MGAIGSGAIGSGSIGSSGKPADEEDEGFVFSPVLDTENGVVIYQPPVTGINIFVESTIRGVKIIQPPIRSVR